MTGTNIMGQPLERNIVERLAAVATELGPIQKRQVNAGSGGNYKAFAVDDVYAHVGPLLAKHGIAVVPSVVTADYGTITSRNNASGTSAHVTMEYTFHSPDDSQVSMRFAAEGHDYQDKATNKAVQQAFKYGLIQMFQIATGEVDPDAAELPDRAEPTAEPKRSPANTAKWAASNYTDTNQDAATLYEAAMVQAGIGEIVTDAEAKAVMTAMALIQEDSDEPE